MVFHLRIYRFSIHKWRMISYYPQSNQPDQFMKAMTATEPVVQTIQNIRKRAIVLHWSQPQSRRLSYRNNIKLYSSAVVADQHNKNKIQMRRRYIQS